jgi:hypothetical protein
VYFEYLCEGEFHCLRQGREQAGWDAPMGVLDQVQMLDKQIPPSIACSEQDSDRRARSSLQTWRPFGVSRALLRPVPGWRAE